MFCKNKRKGIYFGHLGFARNQSIKVIRKRKFVFNNLSILCYDHKTNQNEEIQLKLLELNGKYKQSDVYIHGLYIYIYKVIVRIELKKRGLMRIY